jgi:hypothetical protein
LGPPVVENVLLVRAAIRPALPLEQSRPGQRRRGERRNPTTRDAHRCPARDAIAFHHANAAGKTIRNVILEILAGGPMFDKIDIGGCTSEH